MTTSGRVRFGGRFLAHFPIKCAKKNITKIMFFCILGILSEIPRDPAEVPGASAAGDLPSTRAGGQDDVSSQVTLNSLKTSGHNK